VKPTGTPGQEIDADVTGNAAGSGSISAVASGPGCGTGAGATVPVFCAVPTNFTSTETNLPDGTLSFQYTFQSSTGNIQDLAGCKVGETVFYPGTQNPWVWPLPMVQSTPNPTALYGSGNNAYISDKNGPPSSYKQPYSYAHFQATQRLQWECPCYNSGNYNNFVPDITIDRKVFQDTDGKWKYQIQKSGYTNTVILP
jgi:hypothetical protein